MIRPRSSRRKCLRFPRLPRQMSRGLTPRRFSPCRPRVVPVPRLPILLPPEDETVRFPYGPDFLPSITASADECSRSGVGSVARTFLVSAGFGSRSVATVDEAGKRCVSHVAVRPSRPLRAGQRPLCYRPGPEPTSAPVVPPMPVASGAQPIETISAPPRRHPSLVSAAWVACSVVKRKTSRTA